MFSLNVSPHEELVHQLLYAFKLSPKVYNLNVSPHEELVHQLLCAFKLSPKVYNLNVSPHQGLVRDRLLDQLLYAFNLTQSKGVQLEHQSSPQLT